MYALATPLDDRPVRRVSFTPRRRGIDAVPAGRPLGELLAALGAEPDEGAASQRVCLNRVRRGARVFDEGSAAQRLYVVQSGWFKCTRTSGDGYEQVFGFSGRGDVLGFEGLACRRLPCSAEALEDGSVFALPLAELDALRRQSPALDRALQRMLGAQLMRANAVADMMAATASEVRLARFLVWMSDRMLERGESPRRFRLRMSRREIASLLGVAHETISRSLGLLAGRGQLRVELREIEILDMDGLRATTARTRRDLEPPPAGDQAAPAGVVAALPTRRAGPVGPRADVAVRTGTG